MKIQFAMGLSASMVAGIVIGAVGVQSLHAQSKPPVYLVTEIDTANLDAYMKDYSPLAQKTIKDGGGRVVAAGAAATVEGDPAKTRVVIQVWESADKMEAWRGSADYNKAREIGDKLAKFRAYTVNGVPQ